jgi:hypothetical protein
VEESTLWTAGTIGGLSVLGTSLASVVYATPPAFVRTAVGAEALLAGLLFLVLFLAPGLAMQLYRRGYDYSTLIGGAAGAAFTFCFFGTVVSLSTVQQPGALDVSGTVMLIIVAPIVVGGLCAAGTLFLSDGVRRYREQHGMTRAPARR